MLEEVVPSTIAGSKHAKDPAWMCALHQIIARGGPVPEEYPTLHSLIGCGAADVNAERVSRSRLREAWEVLGPRFMTDTMQGFGLSKPHGYAGDFEMIDRILELRTSADPSLARWDAFFHAQAAPKAVRNRARMFGELMDSTCARASSARILNIGSGPCRDVARWLSANPKCEVLIECIDRDPEAIAYARHVLNGQATRVRLVQRDALRYQTGVQFDFVWSGGLFDYLSDRLFVLLFRRLLRMTNAQGQVVIGNFSPSNPSRNYMELFGEWYLHYRDDATLLRLADEAGVRRAHVISEPEGVNLFLVADA